MDNKRLRELAGIPLSEGFGGMNAEQATQELLKNRQQIEKLMKRNVQLQKIIDKADKE